jgi:hypothetical protein
MTHKALPVAAPAYGGATRTHFAVGGRDDPLPDQPLRGACASANRTQPFGVLFRGEFVGFVIEVPQINRLLGA